MTLSLFLGACFAEPQRVDESEPEDDDTTGGTTSAASASSTTASSAATSTSSAATGPASSAAEADSGGSDSTDSSTTFGEESGATTLGKEPDALARLYEASCDILWESASQSVGLGPAACDRGPLEQNVTGGARLLPMFMSPELGHENDVVVVEPYPDSQGFTQGSLLLTDAVLGASAPTFRATLEGVNLMGTGVGVDLAFQILLFRGNGAGETLVDELITEGDVIDVEVELPDVVPGSELVFIVLADIYAAEEGVALYGAEIVEGR